MKYLKPLELCHEFLKFNNSGRLLGLSVGKTQMGVSVSEACKKVVSPEMSMTVVRTNKRVSALQELISRYSVSGLVIGYPFSMEKDSRFPTAGVHTKRFVDVLNKTRNFEDMNYTLLESTCTTKMLFHALKHIGEPYKFIPMDRHAIRDQHAAYEILKAYFNIVNDSEDEPNVRDI